MPQPKSVTTSQDPKGLILEWSDNHRSVYPFSTLRKACPCALCKGEKMPFDTDPLALPAFPNFSAQAFEAKDLFKVGHYALGFRWGDGHETGIYTWDYLRKMCPCKTCVG